MENTLTTENYFININIIKENEKKFYFKKYLYK